MFHAQQVACELLLDAQSLGIAAESYVQQTQCMLLLRAAGVCWHMHTSCS